MMNFGLSTKYAMVDFEEVSPLDLILIGGGCGNQGGGSTSVNSSSSSSATIVVSTPSASVTGQIGFRANSTEGWSVDGNVTFNAQTGQYTVNIGGQSQTSSTSSPPSSSSGGIWSTIMNFFRGWFGSY